MNLSVSENIIKKLSEAYLHVMSSFRSYPPGMVIVYNCVPRVCITFCDGFVSWIMYFSLALISFSALNIKLLEPLAQGAVDLKSYWPPKNPLAPNFFQTM